ncbi:MAG: EF-P beta-lysylation protein EpmB [Acidiferrobacter sp.]
MIPRTCPARQGSWREQLAGAITDPAVLLAAVGLGPEWLAGARQAASLFPLRVPGAYLARIRRADPDDPLLRQVLPLTAETVAVPGFVADPVGDLAAMAVPGVLQKYAGRVLLTATGACAIHCRYCFRRHFPYAEATAARHQWQAALAYIDSDLSLHEVILSGGDPLTLTDDKLAAFVAALQCRRHIRRLRIHTRLPVVVPDRVDDGLLAWLGAATVPVVVVLHINHPQEIDDAVVAACARLRAAGALLLNQAVLLAGVNDGADILVELSERCLAAGVVPYYLHLLDAVAGAAHFAVSAERGVALIDAVRERLPGYLVPRLVREIPGATAKVVVSGTYER